jgi:hypothetical protein
MLVLQPEASGEHWMLDFCRRRLPEECRREIDRCRSCSVSGCDGRRKLVKID